MTAESVSLSNLDHIMKMYTTYLHTSLNSGDEGSALSAATNLAIQIEHFLINASLPEFQLRLPLASGAKLASALRDKRLLWRIKEQVILLQKMASGTAKQSDREKLLQYTRAFMPNTKPSFQ